VLRPSFTLGGAGGGIAHTHEELVSIVSQGLELSPAHEVLVEESIEGWKEYEMEVMRDHAGNGIIVCSIENLDPMGVHTGDSITVAPAQTLSDLEYQRMRVASLAILEKIGVETGGSNVQFAVNPQTGRLIVIEMNPRVSRSSALASKATGFPIAKAAARLAVGYTLDEIVNDITKATPACFEPTIDYCVVKVPRFAFEKFKGTDPTLTTRMKAVGEIMAIGRTFEEAFGKAMRSLEDGHQGICVGGKEGADKLSDNELAQAVATPTEHRIFFVVEALRRGWDIAQIHAICGIDPWYLNRINDMVQVQESIRGLRVEDIDADAIRLLKQYGTSDAEIAALTGSHRLSFFDAVAPIVSAESLDMEKIFARLPQGSGRGSQHEDGRYLRCGVLERHGVPLQDVREHLPHEPGCQEVRCPRRDHAGGQAQGDDPGRRPQPYWSGYRV
jgi:carbamoyl-phosphate synthase large subunit